MQLVQQLDKLLFLKTQHTHNYQYTQSCQPTWYLMCLQQIDAWFTVFVMRERYTGSLCVTFASTHTQTHTHAHTHTHTKKQGKGKENLIDNPLINENTTPTPIPLLTHNHVIYTPQIFRQIYIKGTVYMFTFLFLNNIISL